MFKKPISLILCFTFLAAGVPPLSAQDFSINALPVPGHMVGLSQDFMPLSLKGLVIESDDPFKFGFIMDSGNSGLKDADLKKQSLKLAKYFLTALTMPEDDLWVNLSPYEKDRIVEKSLGATSMGRDLLAQDYILKQLTASLIYPEQETGKKFWQEVYRKAADKLGTTQVPVNTFNKVWIVPDQAVVWENAGKAVILKSHLKVMLEEDYLAMSKSSVIASEAAPATTRGNPLTTTQQVLRDIVVPELEREVNQGKNFAPLRQMYQAMILATWYKTALKNSIINQIYSDRHKTKGIEDAKQGDVQAIYNRYLAAFKKGAFNYIKDEPDPVSGRTIPRKYFSGGFTFKGLLASLVVVIGLLAPAQQAESFDDFDRFGAAFIAKLALEYPSPEAAETSEDMSFYNEPPLPAPVIDEKTQALLDAVKREDVTMVDAIVRHALESAQRFGRTGLPGLDIIALDHPRFALSLISRILHQLPDDPQTENVRSVLTDQVIVIGRKNYENAPLRAQAISIVQGQLGKLDNTHSVQKGLKELTASSGMDGIDLWTLSYATGGATLLTGWGIWGAYQVRNYLNKEPDIDDALDEIEKLARLRNFKPVVRFLKHSYPRVRLAAVTALGNSGYQPAVEPLLDMLKDEQLDIRRATVSALWWFKVPPQRMKDAYQKASDYYTSRGMPPPPDVKDIVEWFKRNVPTNIPESAPGSVSNKVEVDWAMAASSAGRFALLETAATHNYLQRHAGSQTLIDTFYRPFLRADDPLTGSVFDRVDNYTAAEVIKKTEELLELPATDTRGFGLYKRWTLRELFLNPTTGLEDVSQALANIFVIASPNMRKSMGRQEQSQYEEKFYLMFRAMEILSTTPDLFHPEDAQDDSRTWQYLIGLPLQINSVWQEAAENFLSFSELLIEQLLERQDGSSTSRSTTARLARAMSQLQKSKNRSSVKSYLALLDKLEARSKPWAGQINTLSSTKARVFKRNIAMLRSALERTGDLERTQGPDGAMATNTGNPASVLRNLIAATLLVCAGACAEIPAPTTNLRQEYQLLDTYAVETLKGGVHLMGHIHRTDDSVIELKRVLLSAESRDDMRDAVRKFFQTNSEAIQEYRKNIAELRDLLTRPGNNIARIFLEGMSVDATFEQKHSEERYRSLQKEMSHIGFWNADVVADNVFLLRFGPVAYLQVKEPSLLRNVTISGWDSTTLHKAIASTSENVDWTQYRLESKMREKGRSKKEVVDLIQLIIDQHGIISDPNIEAKVRQMAADPEILQLALEYAGKRRQDSTQRNLLRNYFARAVIEQRQSGDAVMVGGGFHMMDIPGNPGMGTLLKAAKKPGWEEAQFWNAVNAPKLLQQLNAQPSLGRVSAAQLQSSIRKGRQFDEMQELAKKTLISMGLFQDLKDVHVLFLGGLSKVKGLAQTHQDFGLALQGPGIIVVSLDAFETFDMDKQLKSLILKIAREGKLINNHRANPLIPAIENAASAYKAMALALEKIADNDNEVEVQARVARAFELLVQQKVLFSNFNSLNYSSINAAAEDLSSVNIGLYDLETGRTVNALINVFKRTVRIQTDKAQATPGGIALKGSMLDLNVQHEGKGAPLSTGSLPMSTDEIPGLTPRILDMKVINLPAFLGLNTSQKTESLAKL